MIDSSNGILIDCDDVMGRVELLLDILKELGGCNIVSEAPDEGWESFSEDVFDRYILVRDLTPLEIVDINSARLALRNFFPRKTSLLGHGFSVMRVGLNDRAARCVFMMLSMMLYLYDDWRYFILPSGIKSTGVLDQAVGLLRGNFGYSMEETYKMYIDEIHSIFMKVGFVLAMPLWGTRNFVSLLLSFNADFIRREISSINMKTVRCSHSVLFSNPYDGPYMGGV